MKKLVALFLVLISTVSFAQKKEKIKGNREVLIKKFTVPSYQNIEVGEKFKIGLVKTTDTTRIEIETDDNLFDVIHFSVENGTLKFNTSKDIVKKKRLRITVFVPETLSNIKVFKKGKIFNEEPLQLNNLSIDASEHGKTELNLNIKNDLNISGTDKAEIKIEGTTKNLDAKLSESAEITGDLSTKNMNVQLDDHAKLNLKGNAGEAKITLNNKSQIKASDFAISNLVLRANDKSNAYINVKGNLSLRAIGNAEIYIYNNPKITLKAFKDNAIIYKK